ncbi:type VI secretion system protein ImpJ [Roseateles sp. YR242]|uniref:type VI secretion system baseplate subunit TssK n=1 Tax=Roseateles sp. YR242 TaxID=1855305 RepID=UPI0008D3470D|nr:type VI secretion system baseplate subunit TssK [Roseateles sp. YR242]SEK22637.1 type VI secretion system protein ImpJ [Roseateles sp. YR242]
MNHHLPVLWTEGLFLRPQHFQQQDRHQAWQLRQCLRALAPWHWGWQRLSLDASALQIGRIALAQAQGVMPDGVAFDLGAGDHAPAALTLPEDLRDERIVLAWPLSRRGTPDSDAESLALPHPASPPAGLLHTRWRTQELELADGHASTLRTATIQLGRPDLRLMRARDCDEGMVALEVCHVMERRLDQQVLLDPSYLPPLLDIQAHPSLSRQLIELHGLVQQRAHVLAERLSGRSGLQTAEVTDLLLLSTLNRALPLLEQWCANTPLHPQPLYQALSVLLGEMSTHGDARTPAPRAPYDHHRLAECFMPLMADLRQSLSQVLERRAVAIPLIAGPQEVLVATLGETSLLQTAGFVLTVEAQVSPETLRARFPALLRIASADRILDLLQFQLPGVPVQPLPAAPHQLPFQADKLYFSVEGRGHPLWEELAQAGTLALHVAGDLPGLALQLWALRP